MTPSDKIDLVKWFLGSFVIVIITTIISYQFQDREHGLNEMNQYDKYVTELIVLNKDLGKRRLLAQYFAYVTPSDKLKEPWMDYYLLLDKEYKQLQIQDSLITIQLSKSSDTTSNNHVYLLEKQQEIKQKLNDDLVMPNIINNKSDEAAKFERLIPARSNLSTIAFTPLRPWPATSECTYRINQFSWPLGDCTGNRFAGSSYLQRID